MSTRPDTPASFPGGYAAPTPPAPPTSAAAQVGPIAATPARSAAAGRRSSWRALLISALVVLVGGLVAFGGVQLLTRHTEVLAAAHPIAVGTTITADDLTTVSVTKDPNLSPIPVAEKSQIVGLVAQVGLVPGAPLTRAQFGPSSGFTAGQELVALPLKQGQFPARGLVPGQKVLIVSTPGSNSSTVTGKTAGSTTGSASGVNATVAEVGAMNPATLVTVVDVRVTSASGIQVAQLASTGNVAVILLPAGR